LGTSSGSVNAANDAELPAVRRPNKTEEDQLKMKICKRHLLMYILICVKYGR